MLDIKHCVILYEYPRAFIAESKDNGYYAFIENDDGEDCFGWDVAKVSARQISDVRTGKDDVQSLFKGKDLFLAEGTGKRKVVSVTKVAAFSGENAVCGSLFLPNFCDMDETFGYHSLYKERSL